MRQAWNQEEERMQPFAILARLDLHHQWSVHYLSFDMKICLLYRTHSLHGLKSEKCSIWERNCFVCFNGFWFFFQTEQFRRSLMSEEMFFQNCGYFVLFVDLLHILMHYIWLEISFILGSLYIFQIKLYNKHHASCQIARFWNTRHFLNTWWFCFDTSEFQKMVLFRI